MKHLFLTFLFLLSTSAFTLEPIWVSVNQQNDLEMPISSGEVTGESSLSILRYFRVNGKIMENIISSEGVSILSIEAQLSSFDSDDKVSLVVSDLDGEEVISESQLKIASSKVITNSEGKKIQIIKFLLNEVEQNKFFTTLDEATFTFTGEFTVEKIKFNAKKPLKYSYTPSRNDFNNGSINLLSIIDTAEANGYRVDTVTVNGKEAKQMSLIINDQQIGTTKDIEKKCEFGFFKCRYIPAEFDVSFVGEEFRVNENLESLTLNLKKSRRVPQITNIEVTLKEGTQEDNSDKLIEIEPRFMHSSLRNNEVVSLEDLAPIGFSVPFASSIKSINLVVKINRPGHNFLAICQSIFMMPDYHDVKKCEYGSTWESFRGHFQLGSLHIQLNPREHVVSYGGRVSGADFDDLFIRTDKDVEIERIIIELH